ncbi:MAG: GTP-binding protein [Bacillota bacterium]
MKLYIILGYLGSGKTSYVKNLLKTLSGDKNALLVNDFGEVDVDGKILASYSPFTLAGGSMFCSCKSDQFVKVAKEILTMDFDNLVIESSGFSNPYNLKELIQLVNSGSANKLEIVETVTLVDCKNFEKIATTVKMAKIQVAFADVLLLNKTDLITQTDQTRIETLVKSINPNARVQFTSNGERKDYSAKIIEKPSVANIADITLQKLAVKIDKSCTLQALTTACDEICKTAHRIKGSLDIADFKGTFQYSFGDKTLKEGSGGDNTLIILTSSNKNLKNNISALVSQLVHK